MICQFWKVDANGDQMLNVILFVLGKDKNEDLRHKYNFSKIADSKPTT